MTVPVLTAVTGPWEAPLVAALDTSGGEISVVRRCADVTELVTAAAAGLARAAVLSADLTQLDREAVARLVASGVAVVGLADPAVPATSELLTALGVQRVLPADAPAGEIAGALTAAVAELEQQHAPAAAGGRAAGGWTTGWGTGDPGGDLPLYGPPATGPAPAEGPSEGLVVAVWGPPGAPGRTTVAVTLAAETAAAGSRTLLVDADTYGACVAQVLGLLDESAGIAAAARAANQGALDPARLLVLAPEVMRNLHVLTGLPQPRRWPELRGSAMDQVWREARRAAAVTVIDTDGGLETDEELMFDTAAPRRHAATLSALAAADVVIAVGAADPVGLQRLVRGLDDLAGVLPPGERPRVVVNKLRESAVGPRAESIVRESLARFADVAEVVIVPDDRSACDAALLDGRTLTEDHPDSGARLALRALAADLVPGIARAAAPRRGWWRRR